MLTLSTAARAFWQDQEGATMAEYALLLGLIVVALVAAVSGLRGAISGRLNGARTAIETTT
jgi:Flp pilus assembly pilin Flp